MLIRTIGLLAREYGLHTCYQEAWANWPKTLARHLHLNDETDVVFCGLCIGYADWDAPVNQLVTTRMDIKEAVTFH